ncbi:hypothetical protein Sinac_0029 [Singulisphaera acidiphila DSM 18658]|uniref:Sulfatase-modifying factor enzyme-like domain-containing protein n=1 Tax=Singulisphaera acidiphila (strain ATCC BAA-1392 / DSM 18658 / VKM B-2454 / MOB10) TaxID=886293 RepID=L0D5G4_SINAD|nr:hypothetical protein Sinac_0029 [Singulisphaera acidiphila DSM 18658]
MATDTPMFPIGPGTRVWPVRRPPEKRRFGLRPHYQCGLAGILLFLAVSMVRSYFRPPAPPPFKPLPPMRTLAVQITEGQPMTINATELSRAGEERSENVLRMCLCWCPPGRFFMGGGPKGPSGRYLDGEPFPVVISRGFWIGKFEVTQDEWQQVMGKTLLQQRAMDPKQPRPLGDNSRRDHAGMGQDYPIYFTSYREAEEFCYRLSEIERDAGRLEPGWVYRLPTEAEWEFACRAGTTTATAFGDELGSVRANFDGAVPFNNAPAGPFLRLTKPVGSYPGNAWGIHDMHGNVWEWCCKINRPGLARGPFAAVKKSTPEQTIRGGCWYEPGHQCLSTTGLSLQVNGRGSGLGFRVALVSTELWREADHSR